MPNLRIVTKNALRQASLTASSTAGNLAVSSLAAAVKSSLHRFTGTNGSYRATWAAPARLGCVALPFCNWSPTAKQRVRVSKERSATNLFSNSEKFDSASWNKSLGLYAQTGEIAPDGSLSACRIISAGGSPVITQSVRATASSMTLSFYTKKGSRSTAQFFLRNGTTSTNLTTGSFIYDTNAIGGAGWSATNVGGGWYRLSFTSTTHSVGDLLTAYLGSNGGTLIPAGDSWLLWGAMLNEGGLSSYYPSQETFTSRASVGTYIGSDGLIKSAAANTARMQHDPMNPFAPPRLLLEAAATNLLFPSRYSTTTTPYYTTTTAASLVANVQAYRYESISVGSPNMPPSGAVLPNTAGTYCVSAIVEQDITSPGQPTTRLLFYRSSGTPADLANIVLNPATGVSTGATKRGAVKLADRGPNGGALWRIWVAYAHDGTGTIAAYPYPISGGGADQIGNRIIVHHMQLETGEIPTSPIVTTTAAATRAADVYTSAPGVRPDGYIDHWQSYDYDSGWVLACPAPAVELEGFTAAQAASAYAYGGGAYARHWLPQQLDAAGLAVDIADPDNVQGYIEAACMVAGPVWSPQYNASGTSVSVIDRTEISRSAAGDQLAEPGTISRKVPVDLRAMPEADRAKFLELVRNSRAHPILMSVFPEHPDLALERDFMVYGRRTKDSDIAYQFAGAYSTTLEIEEI